MTRSYDEAMRPLLEPSTPELDRFTAAARADIEAAYDRTFGIGETVARRRLELKWSQVELAERAGVPQADISRIERGRANPTLGTLHKVLQALNLNLQVVAS